MTGSDTRIVLVHGTGLEVAVQGTGEPVVLIQTALTAREFLPLATQPAMASFQVVRYHRRAYAGSGAVTGPGSIERDAADCAALLAALGSPEPTSSGCPTAAPSRCSLLPTCRTECTA